MAQDWVRRIGECVLDLERGTLHRGGELVFLRPKTFDLLAYFTRNAGRVVSKDELFDAVWPQTTVTEDSLTQCIRDARKSIGDEQQAVIRTVPRRGYLFQPAAAARTPQPPAIAPQVVVEPMVAVLPFRLGRIDEATKPLFDGVVEEITNALSYFKTIAVLARHSAFALAQTASQDIRNTAERYGAVYLVEGSVEASEDLLNVTVTLSETKSGRHLWTRNISFEREAVLAVPRTIAESIVTTLVSMIENAAMRRVPPAPTSHVGAYVHLLRGIALLRSYGESVNEQGRQHFLEALALDPDSGLAWAYLALAELLIGGYDSAPVETIDQARDKALRAIALSPDEARCHRILGVVLLFRKDFTAAEEHLMRALDLNPYDADTLVQLGYLKALRGRPEEGLALIGRSRSLNPLHPPWYYTIQGDTLFCLGRYGEAAQCLANIPRKDAWHLSLLAASDALGGDLDKATAWVREARRLKPKPDIDACLRDASYSRDEDRERLRKGLTLAGWD